MIKLKKISRIAVSLLLLTVFFTMLCGCVKTEDTPGEKTTGEDEKIVKENDYDFGNSSSWVGDKVFNVDLGDCLVDVYPYDNRYDWGQSILYDEEQSLYKMWWCRHSGYDSIWYAESKDLKNWTNAQKIMTVLQDTEWIKMHVGKPSVLKINGAYVMYYEAPAVGGAKEYNNNIFRATSSDGIHWNSYTNGGEEPYPVIRMSNEQMAESRAIANETGGYGWYGFGQPSALYVDGTYYVYYTHTLGEGDRFYLTTSNDGIHFDEGQQVFLRAGSGVKYNALTKKFMMAYERTQGSNSKVYYMESSNGINFTYSDYTTAANNQNILSKGAGFVRGYPDFVGNGLGHVTTHTIYVAYMEGKMAEAGNDWRQYSSTWDIHIVAFNPPEFEKRTIVLPNKNVLNEYSIEDYRASHEEYENRLLGITKTVETPIIDGEKEALYEDLTAIKIDRCVSERAAVPGKTTASANVGYSDEFFYGFIEVKDDKKDEGDYVKIAFGENGSSTEKAEVVFLKANRNEVVVVKNGANEVLNDCVCVVKDKGDTYTVEFKTPWKIKTEKVKNDIFGFDVYVYDDSLTEQFLSILAWNDYNLTEKANNFGELYFK